MRKVHFSSISGSFRFILRVGLNKRVACSGTISHDITGDRGWNLGFKGSSVCDPAPKAPDPTTIHTTSNVVVGQWAGKGLGLGLHSTQPILITKPSGPKLITDRTQKARPTASHYQCQSNRMPKLQPGIHDNLIPRYGFLQ